MHDDYTEDQVTETPDAHAEPLEDRFGGNRLYWVGIGASAGGLEALRELCKTLPQNTVNITYIVAQHLSPKYQSMMVQLLARETPMAVEEVVDGMRPRSDTIYISPPNNDVFVKNGVIRLRRPPSEHSPKPSVDLLFSTLAEELGDHVIGVVLSGTGSDGAHGVRAIRAGGGLTIAQSPDTAKYDGMPSSSIATECVDLILPPEKIGAEIFGLVRSPHNIVHLRKTDKKRSTMHELMHLLKMQSGVDFSDYKSGTVLRRLNRRLTARGLADLDQYLEYVRETPKELGLLFRDIMITVTQFFRDADAFADLKKKIVELLEDKVDGDPIRVWVPGCATGEEAYSIVILFAEAAGGLAALQKRYKFQLFASDIDVTALALARKGVYAETTLEGVPPEITSRYFHHRDNSYEIVKAIRDMVVFSKHNVFDDPPFLRLDLISCRNLLIYFNAKLQHSVLGLFHYALNPTGILFLGKSEALGQSSAFYQSVDSHSKIFRRKLVSNSDTTKPLKLGYSAMPRFEHGQQGKNRNVTHDFPDAVISALSPDSLLINENMDVLRIYGDIQAYTQLSPGEASVNLTSIIRKEFRQELRALVYKVLREDLAHNVLPKKLNINGKLHALNIVIRPLTLRHSPERLLLISFESVERISDEKSHASKSEDNPVIVELEQELAATQEHLHTVVEELETSNEELRSTNEEMQSTNEELQSSNEELETANEELQSTNEELLTVNEELQVKSQELSTLNQDLENIKESIDSPLLAIDTDMIISLFNDAARHIFVLNKNSCGTALTGVATRIDIRDLRKRVSDVIKSGNKSVLQLHSEGVAYLEKIVPYVDARGTVNGAVLTYENNTQEHDILEQLKASETRYNLAVQGSNAGIWDWDIVADRMHWSRLMINMLGICDEAFKPSMEFFQECIHKDDRQNVVAILEAHLTQSHDFDVEFRMRREDQSYIWVQARGQAIWDKDGNPLRMAGSIIDVSERRLAIEHLSESNDALERFAYICSHDLKEPARLVENFVELFKVEYGDGLDETATQYLTFIEDSAIRMQEMIKSILTYSKFESKNLIITDVNMETTLHQVLENLQLSIEESKASVTHDPLPEAVRADRTQIFQVLQNLIGNALKFCRDRPPEIHVSVSESTEFWTFSVKDNGIGMRAEHTQRIFDVFQRLNQKEEYEGSGIGLSICQKIISRHGGTISVTSEVEKGSVFFFTLPKRDTEIT